MSDTEKLRIKLDEPIPREVISEREGGGSKKLSYLETWYVIDRLNQVLGNLNWSNEIREIVQLPGDGRPAYRAIVRLTVTTPNGMILFKDGIGYGSDKSDRNAHELAMKEAVSDALKVAAKNLGRSMGLALYDKSQEFISDGPSAAAAPAGPVATGAETPAKSDAAPKASKKKDPRALIRSAFQVLQAQRKVEKGEFAEKFLFGKASKDLTDAEADTALNTIKSTFPELGL